MSAENKSVVDRITQAFNDGDLGLLGELVAPEFVGHNPLSPEPIPGPEGLKGFFGAFRAAMPDIKHPSWTTIAEGTLVAIHMPIEGTFQNEIMGIPPNGKLIRLWMCNVWKVVDGKAVEWWLNLDTLSLMQQLGVVPPLG